MSENNERDYLKHFYPIPSNLSEEERQVWTEEAKRAKDDYRRRKKDGLYPESLSFFDKIKGKLLRRR